MRSPRSLRSQGRIRTDWDEELNLTCQDQSSATDWVRRQLGSTRTSVAQFCLRIISFPRRQFTNPILRFMCPVQREQKLQHKLQGKNHQDCRRRKNRHPEVHRNRRDARKFRSGGQVLSGLDRLFRRRCEFHSYTRRILQRSNDDGARPSHHP